MGRLKFGRSWHEGFSGRCEDHGSHSLLDSDSGPRTHRHIQTPPMLERETLAL